MGLFDQIQPPLRDSSRLRVQIAVYVPSTRGDREISESAFRKRIESERKWMDRTWGGDTTIRASGGYLSGSNLISEEVAVVESSTTVREYRKNREAFGEHIKKRRANWKQESIGFEIEGEFFLYPDQPFAPRTHISELIDVV